MVEFKSGPKQAALMLAGLPKAQRDAALEKISKKDASLAKTLESLILSFEDLRFMTIKMLQVFLRDVSLKDLGLALRIHGGAVKDYFLKNVSSAMRSEIEEVLLGPPIPVSKAEEAIDKIMNVVHKKIEKGEIILNKNSDEKFV